MASIERRVNRLQEELANFWNTFENVSSGAGVDTSPLPIRNYEPPYDDRPQLRTSTYPTDLGAIGEDLLNGGGGVANLTADAGTTNGSSPCIPADMDAVGVTVVKSVIMIAIMASAIGGNLLVIVSVLRYEKLRLMANTFIVSLAAADLLVAGVVMPFNASQEIAGRWVFGKTVCDIFNANDVLFSTASLLHLCCISVDRYVAITDPFHYDGKITASRVAVMLGAVWTASAVLSHLPIHRGWYTTTKQQLKLNACTDHCSFEVNMVYGLFFTICLQSVYLVGIIGMKSLPYCSSNHL